MDFVREMRGGRRVWSQSVGSAVGRCAGRWVAMLMSGVSLWVREVSGWDVRENWEGKIAWKVEITWELSSESYCEFGSAFCKSAWWKSGVLLKVYNEKVELQKAECLVKVVKKCIMKKWSFKKLSIWLVLIKVTFWGVNDQKGQCIYKGIYFTLFFYMSLFHT